MGIILVKKLEKIAKDLSDHKYSRDILFKEQVQKRLQQSLEAYAANLNSAIMSLKNRKETTILKRL